MGFGNDFARMQKISWVINELEEIIYEGSYDRLVTLHDKKIIEQFLIFINNLDESEKYHDDMHDFFDEIKDKYHDEIRYLGESRDSGLLTQMEVFKEIDRERKVYLKKIINYIENIIEEINEEDEDKWESLIN